MKNAVYVIWFMYLSNIHIFILIGQVYVLGFINIIYRFTEIITCHYPQQMFTNHTLWWTFISWLGTNLFQQYYHFGTCHNEFGALKWKNRHRWWGAGLVGWGWGARRERESKYQETWSQIRKRSLNNKNPPYVFPSAVVKDPSTKQQNVLHVHVYQSKSTEPKKTIKWWDKKIRVKSYLYDIDNAHVHSVCIHHTMLWLPIETDYGLCIKSHSIGL